MTPSMCPQKGRGTLWPRGEVYGVAWAAVLKSTDFSLGSVVESEGATMVLWVYGTGKTMFAMCCCISGTAGSVLRWRRLHRRKQAFRSVVRTEPLQARGGGTGAAGAAGAVGASAGYIAHVPRRRSPPPPLSRQTPPSDLARANTFVFRDFLDSLQLQSTSPLLSRLLVALQRTHDRMQGSGKLPDSVSMHGPHHACASKMSSMHH